MADTQSVVIPIGGMHCQHCSSSVASKLTAIPGVTEVDVSLDKGQAVVSGTDLNIPALRAAIEELGFDAGDAS